MPETKCFHCGKAFKKLTQNHTIKCELLKKSKNIILNIEEENVPSTKKCLKCYYL